MPFIPLQIGFSKIYNQFGYLYYIHTDKHGIRNFDGVSWNFSIDDRLWPIYKPDDYAKAGKNFTQHDNISIVRPKYPESIPDYFQMIDGRIRFLRIKNAAIDYAVNDMKKSQDFLRVVKQEERDPWRTDDGVLYPLTIDGQSVFAMLPGRIFGSSPNTDIRKLQYSRSGPNFFLSMRENLGMAEIRFIQLTGMYKFIIEKSYNRYEQSKFKIDVGERAKTEWWNLLQEFNSDVLYFQIDVNGILQTFHSRPSKGVPERTTFTGDAYDLNFSPPRKIDLIMRSDSTSVTTFVASPYYCGMRFNHPKNSDHQHVRSRRRRSKKRGQVMVGRTEPQIADKSEHKRVEHHGKGSQNLRAPPALHKQPHSDDKDQRGVVRGLRAAVQPARDQQHDPCQQIVKRGIASGRRERR